MFCPVASRPPLSCPVFCPASWPNRDTTQGTALYKLGTNRSATSLLVGQCLESRFNVVGSSNVSTTPRKAESAKLPIPVPSSSYLSNVPTT